MVSEEQLIAALSVIRDRGALGEASLVAAVQRCDAFVVSVPADCRRLVDIGSGGGLPGLVLAARLPDLTVTLIERRRTRADMLARAVRSLGLDHRCLVLADDVRRVGERVRLGAESPFDVCTARSFGPPQETLRCAMDLVRPGGLVVIAEPPTDDPDRWPGEAVDALGAVDLGKRDGVRIFQRRDAAV